MRQLELALDRGRSKLFGRRGSWQDHANGEGSGNEQTDRHNVAESGTGIVSMASLDSERADDGRSRSPPSVTLPPNFRPSYLQQAAFTQIGQAPVASDDPRVLDDPFALDF